MSDSDNTSCKVISDDTVLIKFSVYGKNFEKSVSKSLLDTKSLHQIRQKLYKDERYQVLRNNGIGKEKYKPKRKNQHYNNDTERLEITRKRSR